MSRATRTDFPGAFRLVITRTLGDEEHTEYIGPYQTIGAAKGQLTRELEPHSYEHYSKKVGHIEVSTGWERVEPPLEVPVEAVVFEPGLGFVVEEVA